MPVIIMTGIPCSGKTTRTCELKEYFINEAKKKVEIINEIDVVTKTGFDRNQFFAGQILIYFNFFILKKNFFHHQLIFYIILLQIQKMKKE